MTEIKTKRTLPPFYPHREEIEIRRERLELFGPFAREKQKGK
jgi:hypothetical protein